jgi:hypothetical protein
MITETTPSVQLCSLRSHLEQSVSQDRVQSIIDLQQWMETNHFADDDIWYEWTVITDDLFQKSAKYGSILCMEYINNINPQTMDQLSIALIRNCELYCNLKTQLYYTAHELLPVSIGQRKKKYQIQILDWLVSKGADINYIDDSIEYIEGSIAEQKTFACVSYTLLWYQNASLLSQCSIRYDLEIGIEEIEFWIKMLKCNQENWDKSYFPYADQVGITLSNVLRHDLRYMVLMKCCELVEHFLIKIFYMSLPESYKTPKTWSWMEQKGDSYLITGWILETTRISHNKLMEYVAMYPLESTRKRRKN